jgi:pimeloyl-ACP methyl ester carboxylesterase
VDETERVSADGHGGTVGLRDGRTLGYAEYGDPAGSPLLYFHGHPGSRLEAAFLATAAHRAQIRLVGVDRPGMGNVHLPAGAQAAGLAG